MRGTLVRSLFHRLCWSRKYILKIMTLISIQTILLHYLFTSSTKDFGVSIVCSTSLNYTKFLVSFWSLSFFSFIILSRSSIARHLSRCSWFHVFSPSLMRNFSKSEHKSHSSSSRNWASRTPCLLIKPQSVGMPFLETLQSSCLPDLAGDLGGVIAALKRGKLVLIFKNIWQKLRNQLTHSSQETQLPCSALGIREYPYIAWISPR